jgi:hypothetical protein
VVASVLEVGTAVQKYAENQFRRTARGGAFLTSLRGHTVVACNASGGSLLFEHAYPGLRAAAEFGVTFYWHPVKQAWLFGLYDIGNLPEDLNLGGLAREIAGEDGGGRKQAAGFSLKELPEADFLERTKVELWP